MKIILSGLLGFAISIGVVMFYTYVDYSIVALVTFIFVIGAWIYGRIGECDR